MIGRAFRMFGIAMVLARYRLDTLILDLPALRLARIVRVLPWGRRGVRGLPRGARLRLALQELGPVYVKFGQILSTRRDVLPADIADELAELQEHVPAFPGEQARAIVEQKLGKPIDQLFRERSTKNRSPRRRLRRCTARYCPTAPKSSPRWCGPGIEQRIEDNMELLSSLAGWHVAIIPRASASGPTRSSASSSG